MLGGQEPHSELTHTGHLLDDTTLSGEEDGHRGRGRPHVAFRLQTGSGPERAP